MEYKLQIPAVRGRQCKREYYTAIIPFGLLPKLFLYNEDIVPPEIRCQRVLNEKRIPEIANYILFNDDWLFSSLTATVSGEVNFVPFDITNRDTGILEIDMNANLYINDGQHRRAGIIEAMKQNPELQNETISVVIYKYESDQRMNQMFADLNRYAQKPSKSLNILYDSRDPLSRATSEMVDNISLFQLYTDKDRVSLPAKSPKLFTLGSLYEANKNLLRITKRKLRDFSRKDTQTIIKFWQEVVDNMPLWKMVQQGDMKPWELRQEYICSHSVAIQALGITGSYLLEDDKWRNKLKKIADIDWHRNNRDWKGIVISANGRVVNSKPVANLTAVFIRKKLGLEIGRSERKELESVRN